MGKAEKKLGESFINRQKVFLCLNTYTVRPNTVAGKAGHVRLERPIDSSSDKLSVHRR